MTGDGDTSRAEGSEINLGCVEFDAVGQDYIVVKMLDTDASDPIISYMQFTYDSNDHFGTAGAAGADLDGTPATMAAWATAMATTCAAGLAVTVTGFTAPGGIVSSIAYMDWTAGLSTDIQVHTLGA